jgi:hypothetical protein
MMVTMIVATMPRTSATCDSNKSNNLINNIRAIEAAQDMFWQRHDVALPYRTRASVQQSSVNRQQDTDSYDYSIHHKIQTTVMKW